MENMRTAVCAARGPRIKQGKSAKDCRPRQAAAALGGRSGWGGTRVALGGRSRATRTGLKATAPGATGRENREKATWWHTLQSSQQASAAAGASRFHVKPQAGLNADPTPHGAATADR